MTTPLVIGDIVRVQAICTQGVQTALNTFFYRVSAVVGGTIGEDAVASFYEAALAPLYKAIMTTTAAWYGALAQKVYPAPARAHYVATTNGGAGVFGATPAVGEVCSLLICKTALAGRAFRGRVYLPFLDLTAIAGGNIDVTGAYAALAPAIGVTMYQPTVIAGGPSSVTLTPVIFHRKANKAGTTTPGSTTDVNRFLFEVVLATQRRRGARGRANLPPV